MVPIKKITKGESKWSTKKVVLVWAVNTSQQLFTLLQTSKYKILNALVDIPRKGYRVTKKKGSAC